MIAVLLTGRAGSKSIPGKNVYPVLGRPLAFYPMWAALRAGAVDTRFVSTDSPEIAGLARSLGITVIDRPDDLAGDTAELVDAIRHALRIIGEVEYLVTMHCNVAYHRQGLVEECIATLQADAEADSCVSGYLDRAVHPYRTRRVVEGCLQPWLEVPPGTSSNRQALDPCFVLDGAARVMRVDRCFPPSGPSPFAYLGNRVIPVVNGRGGDVHGMEDVAVAEELLRRDGWTQGIVGDPQAGSPL